MLFRSVSSPVAACSPPPPVPIKERSLLSRETHQNTTCLQFQSTAQSSDLPHPVLRRAQRAGTVGLRNCASSSPVREKGDKVFGERCRATTDGFSITDFFTDADAEEVFPNDDYFPDIKTLFNDDMGDNINANACTVCNLSLST